MNSDTLFTSSARARALRRRQPYNAPLPSTMRWMAMLPSEVRPLSLLKQYPRIANLLARIWGDPEQCQHYFDDLLLDRRGHRAGFPLDVLEDLLALRDYYLGRYPQQPREAALAAH